MAQPTDVKTGQPIYYGAPGVGLRNVGSYQVSGEPWITGSDAHVSAKVMKYDFPYVTREVSVYHQGKTGGSDGVCRVHFVSGSRHDFSTTNGFVAYVAAQNVYQGIHFVDVPLGNTITFRAKVKEIYIAETGTDTIKYRIMADLTNVPTGRMYELTGSGHTENLPLVDP